MIYDTKTGHIVGNQGYVSVDTPNPGEVARFGDYTASGECGDAELRQHP
jgi:hypothetical protein